MWRRHLLTPKPPGWNGRIHSNVGRVFCAEGIMDLFTYFFGSKSNGAHWLLLHGLVTLLLGSMIWRRWPLSSLWAVGILAGVSILLSGATRLLLALAVRRQA